jgi:metal-responsive CopG/Arc/MetJ family transcriptional regulator
VVRGASATVKKMADALLAAKGVKHGRLTIASIGRGLAG